MQRFQSLHVLVAATYPLILEGLKAMLRDEPGIILQGEAHNGSELIEQSLSLDPELVLLDLDLLLRDGDELVADMQQTAPGSAIIVIAEIARPGPLVRLIEMGVRGYLPRTATAAQVTRAIQAAAIGLTVIHPSFLPQLLSGPQSTPLIQDELIEPLSQREREVIQLLARGLANKQIAVEMSITEHTVKFHIRSILGKLGAANRTEAVTAALQRGLVSL